MTKRVRVTSVVFSPEETFFAAAGTETVRLWHPDGRSFLTIAGHDAEVLCLDISPDGKLLASGGKDSQVGLFNIPSRSWNPLKRHTNWVRTVAIAPNNTIIASGAEDATIRIWQLPDGQLLKKLKRHRCSVTCLDFSPHGTLLASGSTDQTVRLWDISDLGTPTESDLGETQIIDSQLSGAALSVAFSPTGELLASGGSDGKIQLFRVTDGKLDSTLAGHDEGVESIAFSMGGEILASSGRDGRVQLWHVPNKQIIRTIEFPEGTIVSSAAISNSGKWLVLGLSDGTARLWKSTELKEN